MNIDDIDIDYFDEIPNKGGSDAMEHNQCFFPIIGKKLSDSGCFDNGTGFFVNSDGYFVTAGHVLKKSEFAYFAIIDNEEHEFKILFVEYLNIESQDGHICRDLAICKLDLQSKYQTLLNEEDLNKKYVNVSGFKREHQGKLAINPIKQGELYLHNYTFEKEQGNIIEPLIGIDNRYKCINTKTLITIDGIKYDGLSGGPVYSGKNIYGMFISKEYILSSYIISKLVELGISYNQ